MLHQRTARLARWQVRLLSWSGGVLWTTGVVWLLLHNFWQAQGEFGPETNPAEPWMLRLHGAAMVVALLGAGGLLVAHVWRGWHYRRQRVLGVLLVAVSAVLILSGYLLYYVGDDGGRAWISLVHWATGLAALPTYALHYANGRRQRADK